MTASFGAPAPTSNETGALRQINSQQQTFVNKDFVKNISWLNQSVDVLSAYTQKLQAGVDSANSNVIDQIQGLIADIMTVFAGGEPTGINLGDLRYVFQAIGAMLGINPDTPFPLNLIEASTHWFDNFIAPLDQLSDMIWHSIEAWAEDLGFSDAAVDAMEEFNDAVINWYNGLDEAFGTIGEILVDFFKVLGLGSGSMNLGPLGEFWNNIVQHIQDILEGPEQTLLAILSNVVVVIMKALTWIVNVTNPMNLFGSTGIKFVGPQLAPVVSGATTDWSVGSNLATSWVYDATTNREGSDGAFKTSGNSSAKRVLSQVIQQCTPGVSYYLSGWIKWDSIPANVDTLGLCVVFYSGSTEISTTNVNIATGHGATGGWQQLSQVIVVPQSVDGFKLGARVSNSVASGTVWVNGLSYTMEQPLAQGILDGILAFPQHVVDSVVGGLQNTVDWVVGIIQDIFNFFFGSDTFLGHILASVIPALDASIIATGQFAQNLVAGLVDFIHDVLNFFFGEDTFLGHVLASVIPALDASIIATGQFAQAMVTNLTTDLGSKLMANVFVAKLNAGANIATNPSFELTNLYLGGTGVSYSTEKSRFLFHSAKLIADHTNYIVAYLITSDTAPIYVNCTPNQVFYMEAYIYGKSSNTQTSGGGSGIGLNIACTDEAGTNTQYASAASLTASTALNGAWTKLSGYVVVPSGAYSFTPYVQLTPSVTSGDAYYADSVVCREVTDANQISQALYASNTATATVLSSVVPSLDASKITTGTIGTGIIPNLDASKVTTGTLGASRIPDITRTMSTDLQATIDGVHQAVNGGIGSGQIASTIKTNLQTLFNNIFGQPSVTTVLTASAVPSLDASKITTGTLATGQVPSLDAGKITTGSFAIGRIPNVTKGMSTDLQDTIDNVHQAVNAGSATGNTVLSVKTNLQTLFSNLFGQTSVATVLTGGAIPSLDASKVTTGSFGTGRIPSLPASQITTGTFGSAFIADLAIKNNHINDLSGSKVNAGSVAATYVGALDASKVTTGTFGTAQIPSLDTGKITTGTFSGSRIANLAITNAHINDLSGSKVNAGTVAASYIGALDASKITSGRLNSAQLPANVSAVGSGVLLQRTGSSSAFTTYYDGNGRKLPWGFYDSTGSLVTSDMTVSNVGGFICATASSAGWYLVDINYQLKGASDLYDFTYMWGLTPVIYKSSGTTVPTVPFKWGNTGVCIRDTNLAASNSWSADFCSGNFIVYLAANETIYPGYFWSREGSASSAEIIIATSAAGAYGTYFAMSLLNRSLV